jgi:energy-coupling factor transporter ATP-binding protein EcfA2
VTAEPVAAGGHTVIRVERLSFAYPGSSGPALRDLDLRVGEGELVLVVGSSGSGKSTLLRCLNGLVPHFSGGTFAGRVQVAGRDTRTTQPRDLADVVGLVFQDPEAQSVAEATSDEIAFAMENLELAPAMMRRRLEEVLDLLQLAPLRERQLATLSGGERQRVAIAAVLAAQPRVLLLDEPTSQLDPQGAEEVLGALERLVHELGLTVVLAEHRLERVAGFADRVLCMEAGRLVADGPPREVLGASPLAPPVTALGRLAGWTPLPLTVREARRQAGPLRERLAPAPIPARRRAAGRALLEIQGLRVAYPGRQALRGVDLEVAGGEVVALMGRNGAGKTTLLRAAMGLVPAGGGRVRLGGRPVAGRRTAELAQQAGFVPQDPSAGLFAETVEREVAFTARNHGLPPSAVGATLAELGLRDLRQRHPRDLSAGQRLLVALAAVLVAGPRVLLLDEPTRGLDAPSKQRLVELLAGRRAAGAAVVLATHDVELAARIADRVALLAEGEVVASGPVEEVLSESAVFSPQVARVLGGPWLTVAEVGAALEATA